MFTIDIIQPSYEHLHTFASLMPKVFELRQKLWGSVKPLVTGIGQEGIDLEESFAPVWAWLEASPMINWDEFYIRQQRQELPHSLVLPGPNRENIGPLESLPHERIQTSPDIDPFDIPNEHLAPPTENHLKLLEACKELLQSDALTVGSFFKDRMRYYFNDLAEFITAGVVPRLAAARGTSEAWYSDLGTYGRRITIDIFDPDSISPEQVTEIYKQLRGKVNARELKERTEALAILELEIILERALALLDKGDIDLETWEWRPEPTPLKEKWRRRAKVLGLNEGTFKTRQSVSNFQKRIPFSMYRAAIIGMGSSGERPGLLHVEITPLGEN